MVCLDYGQENNCVIDGVRVIKAHKPDEGIPVLRFIHPRATSLWSAMKKARADIYYQRCAGMYTGLVALFCKTHKKKMIYSIAHDTDLMPGKELLKYQRDKITYRWGLKQADVIIAQTPEQQRLCRENLGRDSLYIKSCYEPPRDSPQKKKTDVLWVSTIRPFKQPEFFIQLARKLPEYRFMMVGGPASSKIDDPYFMQISELAKSLPNLVFVGFVPYAEIDKYFDQASLFVNTSKSEGFPNTFLQSWARGIPSVSFFDMHAEYDGKKIGVVVDNLDEMTFRIQYLLKNEIELHNIGELGKKYTKENHSPQKITSVYEHIFRSL